MKYLLTIPILLLWANSFSQDSPETAFEVTHTWSNPQMVCTSFEEMTDSPESAAIGPDFWLKTVAATSQLTPLPGTYDCPDPSYVVEVFDSEMESLYCSTESCSCNSWVVAYGQTYYVSFTDTNPDDGTEGIFPTAITHQGGIWGADGNGDFVVNGTDLLLIMMVYGIEGPLSFDFNHDFLVNANDLLHFLRLYGGVSDPSPCD